MKPILPLFLLLASSVWAAPVFVQASSGGQAGSQTTVATDAKSTTAGNTLVFFVSDPLDCSNAATVSVTDTAGNTFYQVGMMTVNGNQCFRAFVAKNITANASNVITATFSTSLAGLQCSATEWSGVSGSAPRDLSFSVHDTSTAATISSGPFSTFFDDEAVVIGAYAATTTGSWVVSSGYTIPSGADSTNSAITTEYKIYTAKQTAISVSMTNNFGVVGMCLMAVGLK